MRLEEGAVRARCDADGRALDDELADADVEEEAEAEAGDVDDENLMMDGLYCVCSRGW